MEYALLFTGSQAAFELRTDPKKGPAFKEAFGAYIKAIQESGIVRGGAGLLNPDTGVTVSVENGARQVHDGPYAESKEWLAGLFLVEVPDQKTALEWAARSPWAEFARVEVRPVMPRE